MVTTADYWPTLWWSPPLHRLFVQEQGAEKKVMNRTARAWYKCYAYSAKLDRIVDHNESPKSTGAKGYVCPGTAKSTGAIFPLPLWVRRLCFCEPLQCNEATSAYYNGDHPPMWNTFLTKTFLWLTSTYLLCKYNLL